MKTATKKPVIKLEELPQAKVEIINLIDVLITLIAFFMLTTVFANQHHYLKINLPEVKQSPPGETAVRKVVIELNRQNRIMIHNQVVSLNQLATFLQGQPDDTVVVIRADKTCRYDNVMQVVDRVKESRLKKLSFEVKQVENGKGNGLP